MDETPLYRPAEPTCWASGGANLPPGRTIPGLQSNASGFEARVRRCGLIWKFSAEDRAKQSRGTWPRLFSAGWVHAASISSARARLRMLRGNLTAQDRALKP